MITTRAPLRIPLGGGGTDLPSYYAKHGGFVISMGIDKYVYIQLNRLEVEDFVRVKYARTELVEHPKQIIHPLLRESLIQTQILKGIEISALSDIPGRTGMGSSGSFTVSLLAALHAYKREHITTQNLAEEAFFVEAERAQQPTGKQDPYIGAFGNFTRLDIDQLGKVTVSKLQLPKHVEEKLSRNILLFFTGIRRESFDILTEQASTTIAGDSTTLENLHKTKQIGYQIHDTLISGDLESFGKLLNEHWMYKKNRSQHMSNPDIDRWYKIGRAAGALGGKILGAGGGGFLMFYCPAEHHSELRDQMAKEGLREMSFNVDRQGAKILMNLK